MNKKILRHLGLWDVKRKPCPTTNATPIDVSSAYDEQPGLSTDDYIRDPDYLLKPIFKTTLGQPGFLCPKSQHFTPVRGKCLLDNTIGTLYMNQSHRLLDDDCRFFGFHYILLCIRLPHITLSFRLLRSKKGIFYQFNNSKKQVLNI